jgi:hypothetical protein
MKTPTFSQENSSELPEGRTPSGFILLESLIALAMVSILSLGTLTIIETVSVVYGNSSPGNVSTITTRLSIDPDAHQTEGRIRLESVRSLDHGGSWRIYHYRKPSGDEVTIPIYVAPNQ